MVGYFPKPEFEERWRKVHDAMGCAGHDVALVWGKTAGTYERSGDVVYLTDFYSTQSGHEPDSALWNARSYSGLIPTSINQNPWAH